MHTKSTTCIVSHKIQICLTPKRRRLTISPSSDFPRVFGQLRTQLLESFTPYPTFLTMYVVCKQSSSLQSSRGKNFTRNHFRPPSTLEKCFRTKCPSHLLFCIFLEAQKRRHVDKYLAAVILQKSDPASRNGSNARQFRTFPAILFAISSLLQTLSQPNATSTSKHIQHLKQLRI